MKKTSRKYEQTLAQDSELEQYVAQLVINQARQHQTQLHQRPSLQNSRPNRPTTNHTFLSNVIRHTDSHNTAMANQASTKKRKTSSEYEPKSNSESDYGLYASRRAIKNGKLENDLYLGGLKFASKVTMNELKTCPKIDNDSNSSDVEETPRFKRPLKSTRAKKSGVSASFLDHDADNEYSDTNNAKGHNVQLNEPDKFNRHVFQKPEKSKPRS